MPKGKSTEQPLKKGKGLKSLFDRLRKLGPVREQSGQVHAVVFLNPKRHRQLGESTGEDKKRD